MNVSELFALTEWITNNIVKPQIPQKYQILYSALQQNVAANKQKQPFEEQKEDLISALLEVPLSELSYEQLNFLNVINLKNFLGRKGADLIEDILYKNAIDIATSAKKISEIHQNINKGIIKFNQIKASLQDCIFELEEEYEKSDEVLIRVTFKGDASMSNLSDFKECSKDWYDIGRGIAMAHSKTPEDIRLIGAAKGSIVIELSTVQSIATTVSGVVIACLKATKLIHEIRKLSAESRKLNLENKKIYEQLEKEADDRKEAEIKKISSTFTKKLKIKDGEKENALKISIEKIFIFIEKNGEVDFVLPKSYEEEEEENKKVIENREQLQLEFEEIRELKNELKLFGYKEPEEESEE